MRKLRNILFFLLVALSFNVMANEVKSEPMNVREFILHHVADSYSWHITKFNGHDISIPFPVILRGENGKWHLFSSAQLDNNKSYKGFYISHEEKYAGKIVEKNAQGDEIRPLDLSFTKNACSIVISSIILLSVFLITARSFKRKPLEGKKGLVGLMEILILNIENEIAKPSIGKTYRKYTPYLLTLFFFIFLNDLLGIIPIFPGGSNVTGNIAITFTLAFITMLIVNIGGSKEYWKEILWPDVPIWLKIPPIIPIIEIVGIFTKPFALMIRLFASIFAGHAIILGLLSIIFISASMGIAINSSMTVLSIFFTVFISFVELLVGYFQAYIFTLLTAVFIGLARVEPHHAKH